MGRLPDETGLFLFTTISRPILGLTQPPIQSSLLCPYFLQLVQRKQKPMLLTCKEVTRFPYVLLRLNAHIITLRERKGVYLFFFPWPPDI
jgi:hypothetical protein